MTDRLRRLPALALMLFAGLCGTAGAAQNLVHSERSLYREVLVYEDGSERCMCFTRQCRIGRQSCIDLRHPERFALNYTRMMLGGMLFSSPDPKRVLLVGLGGGSIPTALREILPDARIDIVEIDPAVTRVARRFFDFKDDARIRVDEMDGRVFVKRAGREGRQYDVVLLDAFDHEYIPEHLLTREFLTEVKALLAPQGVLVANTFSSSRLYDHESTTYAAVYGSFLNLKRENRVIVAKPSGLPTPDELKARAEQYRSALKRYGVDVDEVLRLFSTRVDWATDARVLTDQYSPANLLNR
jgi:spermidine synthase